MIKVPRFLKKTLKVIMWVIISFVLIFIIIAVLIQIPSIQTKIVHYATTFVSNKTHTRVEIQKISISFPKSIVIDGLFLEDLQKDTLLYAGEAKINVAFKDLLSNEIHIGSVTLEDVNLNLRRNKTDSLFNFNFLITAFSDTTRKAEVAPKKKSPWTFSLDNVSLNNIRLHYDDNYGGTDVTAKLQNLELGMDEIDLQKSIYSIDDLQIEGLSANVLIKESTIKKENKSESILPKIMANNIQIRNSTILFRDLINKQSVHADIKRFELDDGLIDLQKEIVYVDDFYLSKSKVRYRTSGTELSSDSTVTDITLKSDWKVSVKRIYLRDNALAYKVNNKPEIKKSFDSNNLNYKHIKLTATDIYYSSAKTEASIKEFSAIDQNNFAITKFETDFRMDAHSITAKRTKVKTTNSSLIGDLNIRFSSLQSLQDSLPSLILNVDLKKVIVQNSDILYFSPDLIKQDFFKNKTNTTSMSGILKGALNNLSGKNILIKTGLKTILETDFKIIGLPDAQKAYFYFPNLKINSVKQDIKMMAGSSIPKSIEIPENIDMQIVFKGRMKSFETKTSIKSSFGAAKLFAAIDKNENFRSKADIMNFDLGSLLKNKAMYGPVTLTAEANGHGLDKNTVRAKIHVDAPDIYLNKYTYHHLKVDGTVTGQEFAGKINLNDENAVLDFDGLVNLKTNQEHYKFLLNVKGADLKKLNIAKDDLKIGFVATADLKGGTVNEMNGKAGITDIIIAHMGKKYVLDSLLVASINEKRNKKLDISSALIDLKYSGTISPTALPASLMQFTNNYFPFSTVKPTKVTKDSSNFNFEIQLHNHPILSEVLLPQLIEFEPGLIKGSFESQTNDLKLNVAMNKIVWGTTEIKDLLLDVKSDSTELNYKLSSSKISNSQIKLDNFLFEGKLADQKILAKVSSIDNLKNKKLMISSEIIMDKADYKLMLDPKDFYLMNDRWDIAADNYIKFGKKGFLIHHLFMNKTESQINIASVHDKFNDDLNIAINNFKLDDISRIIEKDTSLVKGDVNGNILLKRVSNSYGIIADAKIANLIVKEVPIGNLSLKANNPTAARFDIDVDLTDSVNNFTANGHYIPKGGDNSINIKGVIQSLSMKTVQAFSMGQVKAASGKLTGNFSVQGSTEAPEVTGELVFDNAIITTAVLNNPLELKHETVQLKKDGIYFDTFTLLDVNKHKAVIDGKVQMQQFKNFIFDLQVKSRDFQLFNTTARDNKEFNGRMVIDSRIDVKGPLSLPVINGRVKMKKGSNFTFAVPEEKLTNDKGENIVEFGDTLKLNPILYRDEKREKLQSSFTGYDLSTIIEIDKEATLRLLLDPASTDSLVVKGEAALSFAIDRSGKMSLTGAYNLSDGSYLVSLESVIKKKFDINSGSTIIWNGDPLDADISIDATYLVRAAPYDLVFDQMGDKSDVDKGGYKQRYPFLVLLKLRGEILHPVISFEIQLPPESKGILGGAVNQKLTMLNDDPSALNKQVFALLVLGRFIQENPLQTEGSGTSTLVRSTVGNFLSTQLNQLSSKVVPGVELNFDIQSYDDYQTGQAEGRTQVEIGVKKQLFSERLSVQLGGTVDVEGEKAKQNSASNFTSDITVEYKITKDGRYRLKGFRHNQYEGAIDGQLVETGAGVMYVRNFNLWKEFIKAPLRRRRIKTPPTNKEQ